MGVSGQRHATAALLPPWKGPTVPIGQEAGWAVRVKDWDNQVKKDRWTRHVARMGKLRNKQKLMDERREWNRPFGRLNCFGG
jgi:hypothetical protein